jgi:DNA modification methylase
MRNQILLGDSVEVLKTFPAESVSCTVSDPPYGLGTKEPTPEEIDTYLSGQEGLKTGDFMGRNWDIPSVALWREVYRVMQPGGVLFSFAGTRTVDLMAAGIEAAGFKYRGVLGWVHCLTEDAEILTDSGWLPIVSALEGRKAMCYDVDEDTFSWEPIERQFVYRYTGEVIRLHGNHSDHRVTPEHRVLILTENGEHEFMLARELEKETDIPTLEDEEGMLLSWDRVDVTREPYSGLVGCVTTPTGTFVARHKGQPFVTGNSQGFPKSLNIGRAIDKMGGPNVSFPVEDRRLFATELRTKRTEAGVSRTELASWFPQYAEVTNNWERLDDGFRVPSEEAFNVLVERLEISADRWRAQIQREDKRRLLCEGLTDRRGDGTVIGLGHAGREWTTGTEEAKKWEGYGTALKPAFEPILVFTKGESDWIMPAVPFYYCAKAAKSEKNLEGDVDNNHVTVKPLKLMRFLVEAASKPGDLILDPFLGSGTTAAACAEEGRDFVGIERDPHYHEIASKRVGIVKGRADDVRGQRDLFDLMSELPEE